MRKVLFFLLIVNLSCFSTQKGSDKVKLSKLDYKLSGAIRNKNFALARALLNEGANINSVDQYGETLLYRAVDLEKIDVLSFLIKNGADLGYIDKKGNNYLFYAANIYDDIMYIEVDIKFFEVLLDSYNYDLSHKNKNGETVLDYALYPPQYGVVKLLMRRGARLSNVNKIRPNGRTTLHLMMDIFFDRYYNSELGDNAIKVSEILLKNGANPNIKCEYFRKMKTPLELILPLKEAYNFHYRKYLKRDVLRMESLLRKYMKLKRNRLKVSKK